MAKASAVLVCLAGALRAAAVSLVGILIAIHLASRGLTPAAIGLVIGCGIAGSAVATIATGMWADRWGRRRTQLGIGILSAAGYIGIAQVSGVLPLIAVAFVGLVNGMGRDRGPASALDQAMLPSLTTDERRTWAPAWYNVAIDTGHAVGALAGVAPTLFMQIAHTDSVGAHRATFLICAGVTLASAAPYLALTESIEPIARRGTAAARPPLDPGSRRVVTRLALLFGMDSIGGGFLNSALIAYWFFHRYGTSEADLAVMFFAARVLNAVSHVGAAWLARRIGLVNTMVWTHLPSSLFLIAAPAAPNATLAAVLFLAREALVEMDVPTRQSYVMAVVKPGERTFASGVTNVTRNAAWVVGPSVGGAMMQHIALAGPIVIGGLLKISYDLLLYASFRHLHPPEEHGRAAVVCKN